MTTKAKSFFDYLEAHPQQRFWQALRNWSGYGFILAASERGGPTIDTFGFGDDEVSTTGDIAGAGNAALPNRGLQPGDAPPPAYCETDAVAEALSREETAICRIHGSFYSGFPKCPTCEAMEKADAPPPDLTPGNVSAEFPLWCATCRTALSRFTGWCPVCGNGTVRDFSDKFRPEVDGQWAGTEGDSK